MDSTEKPGSIVQIVDSSHPWFPALLVVSEVKSFGVQAYCFLPQSNEDKATCSVAFNRLRNGEYVVVGEAIYTGDGAS